MTIAAMPAENVDLEVHELMDQVLKCRCSFHPEHQPCSIAAVYVLHLVDVDHEIKHSIPLCDGHAWTIYVYARSNRWCECVEPHRECYYDDVELVRVS